MHFELCGAAEVSPSKLAVADVDSEKPKVKGVVSEVGLERDEDHFRSFNLKISVVVKAGKRLNYEEGERMMTTFKKELLGKEVEVATIMVPCPLCGKSFKSEQGMKQHMRLTHAKKAKKRRRTTSKKKAKKASKPRKKTGGSSGF